MSIDTERGEKPVPQQSNSARPSLANCEKNPGSSTNQIDFRCAARRLTQEVKVAVGELEFPPHTRIAEKFPGLVQLNLPLIRTEPRSKPEPLGRLRHASDTNGRH